MKKSAYKPGKMCMCCYLMFQASELVNGMCPPCRHRQDEARAQFDFEVVEEQPLPVHRDEPKTLKWTGSDYEWVVLTAEQTAATRQREQYVAEFGVYA